MTRIQHNWHKIKMSRPFEERKREREKETYLQTARSSGRTVLHPTHVDFRIVNPARPPIFEVTTERVLVCSPSMPRIITELIKLCINFLKIIVTI